MRLILTALIFVAGLFDLMLGTGFLFDPVGSGAGFGLSALGEHGISTMRADFTAFFFVGGAFMMWGAWKRNADLLLAPAALFGIALTGRIINLIVHGTYGGFWVPMSVEAFHVVLLYCAWKYLPHHTIEEIGG